MQTTEPPILRRHRPIMEPKIKHAIAWRSGRVQVVARCPEGALIIMSGPERKLRKLMSQTARHGHKPGVLLVPGVPEADTEAEALRALIKWRSWVTKRQH